MLLLQLLIAISAGRRTEINIILICHGHREGRKAALLCADGHYAKILDLPDLMVAPLVLVECAQ